MTCLIYLSCTVKTSSRTSFSRMEIAYVLSKYVSLSLCLLVVINNGRSGILSGMCLLTLAPIFFSLSVWCLMLSLSDITTACPIFVATVFLEHMVMSIAFKFRFVNRGGITILHVCEGGKMFFWVLLGKCLKTSCCFYFAFSCSYVYLHSSLDRYILMHL